MAFQLLVTRRRMRSLSVSQCPLSCDVLYGPATDIDSLTDSLSVMMTLS